MTALAVDVSAAGPLDYVQLHTVSDLRTLDDCRRWLGERRPGPLAVDTESGGLSPVRDRHRLTQLGDTRHGWAFPSGWAGAAAEMIRSYPRLVMHHSAYDWRVLRNHQGIEPRWAVTDDTMLAGRIADSLRPAGLKARATADIDPRAMAGEIALADGMRRQHWTWDTVPETYEPYLRYSSMDPVLTALMHEKYGPQMARHRNVYDLERATARVCAAMMDTGMLIDVPFIQAKIAEVRAFLAGARPWLAEQHGITSVRSAEQVGAALGRIGVRVLFRTPTGQPSISKDTLRVYQGQHPEHHWLFEAILKCRKGEDIIGKFLEKFLALADADGIVRYSINTCKARTTRQSVTDPPMQTFDRDEPAIRGAWIPRPGHKLVTIDMDQVEARLAAIFSGDQRMIADFRHADEHGLSFFVEMASKIYGERISKRDPRYTTTKNACVPLSSQILTRRGWLRYDQVMIGDETVGLNLDTGRSEWTPVTGVHVYPESPVQSIGNEHRFRLHATPDHKWATERTYGNHREERCLELIPQDELNKHRDRVILAAPLDDTGTVKLSSRDASVLGWLLSDGTLRVNYKVGGPSQAGGAKRAVTGVIFQTVKKHAAEIDALLDGIPHRRDVRGGQVIWTIRPAWLRPLVQAAGMYDAWPDAEVLACSLDPRSRGLIMDAMRKADGDPFVKGDRWRADFYATLVYLTGGTPVIKVKPPRGGWQRKDCWSVWNSRPFMAMQRNTVRDEDRQPVWCVTTGLGTWTMRQGDAIVLTGNTYGQIYGSGLETAALTAGVPVEQMRQPYEGFRQLYPGVSRMMNRIIREARAMRRPAVQTLMGRWLYIERGKEYGLQDYKVQGSAAEWLKLKMCELDAHGYGPLLRLPVHDELILEVPEADAETVLRDMKAILDDRTSFPVALTWGGKVLDHRWEK